MVEATSDVIARNRAKQSELYGEPLGDMLARLMTTLRVTQARVARVLGVSAPMLSQLATGQRVKIGNPAALQRLQALREFAGGVAVGEKSLSECDEVLAEIGTRSGIFTQSTSSPPAPAATSRIVHQLMGSVASAADWERSAATVDNPKIAEFLRTFGAGQPGECLEFLERVQSG